MLGSLAPVKQTEIVSPTPELPVGKVIFVMWEFLLGVFEKEMKLASQGTLSDLDPFVDIGLLFLPSKYPPQRCR